MGEEQPKVKKQETDDLAPSGLAARERWLAGLIGLLGVGTGGVGIFLSDNQAGTTAILLLGAVFLLMGVQGTAITKAGKDSVELERRLASRRVIEKAEDRLDEQQTEAAADLLSVARTVDPSIESSATYRRLRDKIYSLAVQPALHRAVRSLVNATNEGKPPTFLVETDDHSTPFDAKVLLAGEPTRAVGVKTQWTDEDNLLGRTLTQTLQYAARMNMPLLLVVNRLPDRYERKFLQRAYNDLTVDVVKWNDERDDELLADALRALIAPEGE